MPSRTAGRPRLPYTLALAALLPALPCHADGGDGVPWQPVRALLEPASGPPQASAPQPVPPHSALRCVGVDVDSRACHFKNLYYDRHRARFVVFGEPPSSASDEDAYHPGSRSGRDGDVLRIRRVDPPVRPVQPVLPGWAPPKPFLQLGGRPWYRDKSAGNSFHVIWAPGGAPPAGSGVCVVAEPTHIRSAKRLRSFGHMLRDNMALLHAVPARLGMDASRYTWLQWPTGEPGSLDGKVYQKYKGWVGDIETLTWQEQLAECDASGLQPRYVLWRDALAGWAGLDFDPNHSAVGPAMCAAERFAPLRAAAYARYGITHVAAPALPGPPRVVVLGRSEKESRRFMDAAATVAALQRALPEAAVEYVELMEASPEEQMALLSRTSVLVTTVGSASFRLLFLPDGAAVVLVGAPLAPLLGSDGQKRGLRERDAFRESKTCWAFLGYVSMHHLAVSDPADVALGAGRRGSLERALAKGYSRDVWEWYRVWDADVRLQEAPTVAVVREALQSVATWGNSDVLV